MNNFLVLVFLLGLGATAFFVFRFIFWPNRAASAKKASLALLTSFVAMLIHGYLVTPPSQPTPAKQASSLSSTAEAAARSKEKEYKEELETSISAIRQFNVGDFSSSLEGVGFALALLEQWAKIYDEGSSLDLDNDAQALRSSLKKELSSKQVQALPLLRDRYGPLLRKELWIEDGSAKTVGSGYRTIQLNHWSYAANRAVQKSHEAMHETLLKLRFTRAEYRWVDSSYTEYTYYKMSPPDDGAIGAWSGTSFRQVD